MKIEIDVNIETKEVDLAISNDSMNIAEKISEDEIIDILNKVLSLVDKYKDTTIN